MEKVPSLSNVSPTLNSQGEILVKPTKKRRLSKRRTRYSFADPPKESNSSENLDTIGSPLLSKVQLVSKDYILEVLKSQDINTIRKYNSDIRHFLKDDPNFINGSANDEDIVETFINAFGDVTTAEGLNVYCTLIYPFFKRNTVAFIDNGLLFNLRDKLNVFPQQVLDFYEIIPVLSGYARDAMVSLGIIDDVIDYFKNAKTSNERVSAAKVLKSQFTIPDPFQVQEIRSLIPKIASLLECGDNAAIVLLLKTLSEINGRDQIFTDDFMELGIHTFLAKHITDKELTEACFTLAGNMSICDTDSILKMIDCGLIGDVISLVDVYPIDVFWCLSNCFESSPESMLPLVTDLIPKSLEMHDLPDAACFVATVLLFASSKKIKGIIDFGVLPMVIEGTGCSDIDISGRCLDSLLRLLILSNSNPTLLEVVPIIAKEKERFEVIQKETTSKIIKELISNMIHEIDSSK